MELYSLRDMVFERSEFFRLNIDEFKLSKGDKVAIIGQNGSGKTTFLRVLTFLEKPTSCESFLFRGIEVGKKTPRRDGIGFLKQQPYLFSGSVSYNMAYPLKLRRLPKTEIAERVDKMLNLVDLQGLAQAEATRLSGGEAKRLALGRVLIAEPEIILLDEPVAHLDSRSRRVIERLLLGSNSTILFTTHDLHLAYRIADRVLNLKSGRITPSLPENILVGCFDDGDLVTKGGLRVHLPADVAAPDGREELAIMLDPRHLVISNEPLASSMRNQFDGRVSSAREQGGNVWLEIACGEPLVAIISRESYTDLELNLNKEVVVSFKASALEVI